MLPPRVKAIVSVIIAAALWGFSGTIAQFLFTQKGIDVGWLVNARITTAGALLLLLELWLFRTSKLTVFAPLKRSNGLGKLIIFSFLGMLGVQYTYFSAISSSNAATATFLQYLGPVFISVYTALRFWKRPSLSEVIPLLLALLGIDLLVTKGFSTHLSISWPALFWGIGSAVTLAFYTIYPKGLIEQWGARLIVAWAMLIAGVLMNLNHPIWDIHHQKWSLETLAYFLMIVVLGTMIPFTLYLGSLKVIKPIETSIFACTEPLSAAIISMLWLKVSFGLQEWIGALCIIGAILLLSWKGLAGTESDNDLPTQIQTIIAAKHANNSLIVEAVE